MPEPTTPPADALVVVGRVRKAHGIRGELVVEVMTNEPAAVFAAGRRLFGGSPDGKPATTLPGGRGAPLTLEVRRSSPFKEGIILQTAELTDRTAAEGWRERTLLALEAELPPPGDDEIHLHELVGMTVVRKGDAAAVGEVVDFFELPHQLMLELRLPGAEETRLLPWHPEFVLEVDTRARTILVDPPAGLFE